MRNLYSTVMCGTMLALAVAASAQTLKPGVATIVRIQGEARYSPGDGTWHPLLVGKILGVGTIIQTGHDGTVDMVLGKTVEMPQAAQWPDRIGPAPDVNVRGLIDYKPSVEQNMVRMTGDTMLAIDELTISDTGLDTVSDTELDLKQGRIFCSVKKLSAASEYLVKIPNGVAGVRGTLFEIDASGWCAVLKSSVLLALVGPDGATTTHLLGEGNQFDPQTGQISALPPELLGLLQQIATALDTVYVETVSFAYDGTFSFISPTTGHY
jgi:FecR protein